MINHNYKTYRTVIMMHNVLSKFALACAESARVYETGSSYFADLAAKKGDYANAAGWAAWCHHDIPSYFDWQVVVLLQLIENERMGAV